ncbi:MAG: hypothetical protein HC857_17765 [Synechococcales cyanobacterium RU_4_20]|nr:hypothetical protein [Synechococcales cyanobacterium RU_4_20]
MPESTPESVSASTVELMLSFVDSAIDRQKQETLTQQIFQQMRQMRGVTVERVEDPNPPEGSRGASFLWGLLTAKVSWDSVKNLGNVFGRSPRRQAGQDPSKVSGWAGV